MNWQYFSNNWNRLASAIIFLSLILSGCATLYDPEASQEYNQQIVGILNPHTTIGQIIQTNRPAISDLTIWISKVPSSSSSSDVLTIRLYETLISTEPFFATNISSGVIDHNTPLQISLSPLVLTDQVPFFLELSTTSGEFEVHGRLEDIYPFGQAYQNRTPINADLAFRISYNYGWNAIYEDLRLWSGQIGIVFPLFFTLWLPGFSLLRIFRVNNHFSSIEQAALAIGLSLAIIPIVYLATSLVNIPITSTLLWFITGLVSALLAVNWLIHLKWKVFCENRKQTIQSIFGIAPKKDNWQSRSGLAIILIFSITLFIRLAMVRDLASPAWVDSYHHALITRLIIDKGILPVTYEPYLDIEPTLYHPGFHAALAVFLELSGLDINQGMLVYGQILNALVIFSVYLLATSLTGNRTAGIIAALIAGVFTPMPAYYTSWGRYTQLAGLIILPAPFALFQKAASSATNREALQMLFPSALGMAGLLLVHYRAAAFLVCLLVPYLIYSLLFSRDGLKHPTRDLLIRFGIFFLVAGIFSATWLIPAVRDTILPRIAPLQSAEAIPFFSDFSWQYLDTALGKQSLVLAIIGLGWAVLHNRKIAFHIIGWVGSLFFLSNLDALRLPGGAFVNNSSVTIMLFVPIAITGGYLLSQSIELWEKVIPVRYQPFSFYFLISLLVISTGIGTGLLLSILNPGTILTRQADFRALQWIDLNISDDRSILINPFAWGYGLYTGADGGAWIPALAGNPTIPPPVLYGLGSETEKSSINQLSSDVFRLGNSPDELWRYLIASNIEYIYVGARGGPIFPSSLAENAHFQVLYHEDNTWVFHVSP